MTIQLLDSNVGLVSSLLLRDGYCTSTDEADVVSEIIIEEIEEIVAVAKNDDGALKALAECLEENLGVSNHQAKILASKIGICDEEGGDEIVEEQDDENDDIDEEDDDGVALDEGECELCDRYIQLTKHHLIPKSTWQKMQIRLLHAAEANVRGDSEKARLLLGPGLEHLLEELVVPEKTLVKHILHRTCEICRPCHSAVHKAHSNVELAHSYNTVDLILQDKQIAKFCKWASKQRAGKYSVK